MGRKLFHTILFLLFTLMASSPVIATDKIAGSSASFSLEASASEATVKRIADNRVYLIKKEAIRRVLERSNSPMIGSVDSFIDACRTYDLDCYLLPAIAGLESGYGKQTLEGSYNAFGWGGGRIVFADWNSGIDTVGRGLRNNYINKGATSIESIGSIYAASPTWSARIYSFMYQFEKEEDKLQLFLPVDTI